MSLPPLPNLKIYSKTSLNRTLRDQRNRKSNKFIFGTVRDVARHHGIVVSQENGYNTFSGTKSKLQMFAEKLHFSGVGFTEKLPKE
jgi:hypothetical protein